MAKASKSRRFLSLRNALLRLRPDGTAGFEGLAATALANLTGYTFRLAKSGSQFGRDATTQFYPFAVAMEAKRYSDDVRLETLAGKAAVAGQALGGKVDLWVVAATSAVGDDAVLRLQEILETAGISVLMVDWSEQPLPRLAVLMASARDAVLAWFGRNSAADATRLGAALDEVAADPAFADARDELLKELEAAHTGIAGLQGSNSKWTRRVLETRELARRLFNQYLAPADPKRPAVARPALMAEIEKAVAGALQTEGFVALLGDQGHGKTWAAAQWWLSRSPLPIILVSAGRVAQELQLASDPGDMLARLLARQEGQGGNLIRVASWRRRITNWSAGLHRGQLRFCLVLDGLNEKPDAAWADLLGMLTPALSDLGGLVLATCRPVYWRRSVRTRLDPLLSRYEVTVPEYDAAEQQAALAPAINVEDLSDDLRDFLKNPRICDLAAQLVPNLGSVRELSVSRLLAAYWQHRLVERGDLIGHELRDFEKLLRAHAAEVRKNPNVRFDRDDWLSRSPAAARDPDRFRTDLSEIEEGAFMSTTDEGEYTFREEALPFAMGLLLASELRDQVTPSVADVSELIDSIVEPIRGFDQSSEIVAAAIGIACRDPGFSDIVREALILAFSELPNRTEAAFAETAAHVPLRPNAFLNALEFADESMGVNATDLLPLLLMTRHEPPVWRAVGERLPRWLGAWSRTTLRSLGSGADELERQVQRSAAIDERLAALSSEERRLFDQLCTEQDHPSSLAASAARLTMGMDQAPFADAFVAFALASAISRDPFRDSRELYWAVRLNSRDHAALVDAVIKRLHPYLTSPSEPFSAGAANVLNMLGTVETAAEAERLSPWTPGPGWRRVERFCETDPLDPDAQEPANLDNARDAAAAFDPASAWTSFATTAEDLDLEMMTLGLARFDPDIIVDLLRRIVATAAERQGMPLRQFTWHLARLSPLLDNRSLDSIKSALDALIADPDRADSDDFNWMIMEMTGSILPHLSAKAQLKLFLSLPDSVPHYWNFRRYFKPLPQEAIGTRLAEAEAAGRIALQRTLFFLTANEIDLDEAARCLLERAFDEADGDVSLCALIGEVVVAASDRRADERLLQRIAAAPYDPNHWLGQQYAAWIATLIGRTGRSDLLHFVRPCYLGYVAARLEGDALEAFARAVDHVISRSRTTELPIPETALLTVEAGEDPGSTVQRIDERENVQADAFEQFVARMNEDGPADFQKRQKALRQEIDAFQAAVAADGLQLLRSSPDPGAFRLLAERFPRKVESWLQSILADARPANLRQLATIALSLASAISGQNENLACQVFRQFWNVDPLVNVELSRAKIPFQWAALFNASGGPRIVRLWQEVFEESLDDASIEAATLAVKWAGREDWLDGLVTSLAASGLPRSQALALTISGFRDTNEINNELLGRHWGSGFLGAVAEKARDRNRRNEWARHWHGRSDAANSGADYWRYSELAIEAADRRAGLWATGKEELLSMRRFGGQRGIQMLKRAEKKTKKRKDTLFGLKPAPDRSLGFLLNKADA